jgi:hypothetical protein
MQPGGADEHSDWLVDRRLMPGFSLSTGEDLREPFAIWIPDVLRPGPALVFAAAANWRPAAAYLPAPGQELQVRLILDRRVGQRGPWPGGSCWSEPRRGRGAS